jgi:tol-pal system protein YbgF
VVEVSEPPSFLSSAARTDVGEQPDQADLLIAEAQFERGLDMMKTGNPDGGEAQMQQFVRDWPRHPKADNALYLAGASALAQGNPERAVAHFEEVISHYPAGDAVLEAMLRLGECRLKLNHPREARATWEKIVSTYPGTGAAVQAQALLFSASSRSAVAPP